VKHLHYQGKASQRIIDEATEWLYKAPGSSILLRAPTGSGKTVIASQAITGLVEESKTGKLDPLAFIWVAPKKLHNQSYSSLSTILHESTDLECILMGDLLDTKLSVGQILFFNWSSVDKAKNKFIRESEDGTDLPSVIKKTRESGTKIILIVDESHIGFKNGTEATRLVNDVIAPDLIIEITATPLLEGHKAEACVHHDEVVSAGMIRKSLIINPSSNITIDRDTVNVDDPGTTAALLDGAIRHQRLIRSRFAELGENINPLILIQFPDGKSIEHELARSNIESILLDRYGIGINNGKLAVWLSEESENKDDIDKLDGLQEVLFFKQAIAVGWDCPRAQILVSLRDIRSDTFQIQVLGRILRQPLRKHFNDDLLDHAYVFTNLESFKLDREAEALVGTRFVSVKDEFRDTVLPLPSTWQIRSNQTPYVSEDAVEPLKALARDRLRLVSYEGPLMANGIENAELKSIDDDIAIDGNSVYRRSAELVGDEVKSLVGESLQGTQNRARGRQWVYRALLEATQELTGLVDERELHETIIQHRDVYLDWLSAGLSEYYKTKEIAPKEFRSEDTWTPPKEKTLKWATALPGFAKSLYEQILDSELNELELKFALYLDGLSDVDYWIKNRDNGSENFAIKYKNEGGGEFHLFYVDFIVKFTDGSIGLYDTKGHSSGGTAAQDETRYKANALFQYAEKLRLSGFPVKTGIVVENKGNWYLSNSENYDWSEELRGWNLFSTRS